jgi:hypothetical protein
MTHDWRYLAEEASTELDPKRLMNLVEEMTLVLAPREKTHQRVDISETPRS